MKGLYSEACIPFQQTTEFLNFKGNKSWESDDDTYGEINGEIKLI
jgi:hypothetical protein